MANATSIRWGNTHYASLNEAGVLQVHTTCGFNAAPEVEKAIANHLRRQGRIVLKLRRTCADADGELQDIYLPAPVDRLQDISSAMDVLFNQFEGGRS